MQSAEDKYVKTPITCTLTSLWGRPVYKLIITEQCNLYSRDIYNTTWRKQGVVSGHLPI